MVSGRAQLSDFVFCSTKRVSKSKGKFLYFNCIAFSSVKHRVVSSVPTEYGTVFLRIRGIRCLQSQERFSSLQSFLGVSLFYFLRRLKKEEVIEKKATPLIFFLRNDIYMCICICLRVYVFCVLFCHDPNYLLSTKVCSNILS